MFTTLTLTIKLMKWGYIVAFIALFKHMHAYRNQVNMPGHCDMVCQRLSMEQAGPFQNGLAHQTGCLPRFVSKRAK